MRAPCADVPLPGGRPPPSGETLMSQAAISAGLTGFPSQHYNGVTSWAVERDGEVKHVYA